MTWLTNIVILLGGLVCLNLIVYYSLTRSLLKVQGSASWIQTIVLYLSICPG